jgi:penicillin-binding protein A
MLRQLKVRRHLTTLLCLVSLSALALARGMHGATADAAPALLIAPMERAFDRSHHEGEARLREKSHHEDVVSWARVRREGDGFVEHLPGGKRAELTIDPTLQARAERLLREHDAPLAAAVLLSVEDGRVLALAGRDKRAPEKSAELATTAWAPAASIFKLVTATALVERGVEPDTRVCYHDGVHSVEASNLVSNARLDDQCHSLAFAVAKSQNAIIARLAHEHLDATTLRETAEALGFDAPLPVALTVEPSTATIPEGGLSFARVSAGFWQTTLSPLHGAYLAATLARGGVTPPLHVVDRIVERDGSSERPAPAAEHRVVDEAAARAVARMMVGTTEFGTARLGFHDKRTNRPLLPGVTVAGKTGSLDRQSPYVSYSWFVGFAPAEKPEVAVAVLLGNGADWHVKAHQVARELLSSYFEGDGLVGKQHLARR